MWMSKGMKRGKALFFAMLLTIFFAGASAAQDPGWPRQRMENGNTLIIYQPQVDDWKDFKELNCRMAISLTPKGGKPAVGVLVMTAETRVNNDRNMVWIGNIRITKTHFPSLGSDKAAQMDRLARQFVPPAIEISLPRLVALVPKQDAVPGVPLRSDPPAIFVSYKPAILLDLDGPPVRAPVRDTGLEYVVNTHWPLFFDTRGSRFYLLAGEQWLTSEALGGPWSATKKLPKDMDKAIKEPQWADLKKYVPPPRFKSASVVPAVFLSTTPAEVILFSGKPDYAQIPGTRLRYATNTTSYLFLDASANRYYYLTAGRWFSADSLGGPWTFASPSLPTDFARIPPSSPAGQVLASVPGTEEAKDAVLLAQIPTTVIVDPATAAATVKVIYVGEPKFVLIEGTSLYYATNTAQRVIKASDRYYLCLQGIWFVSTSPQGPWQTAGSVPQVIYTIPPASPVYNVTYVTQVTTADGHIEASYTAGYMGAFVMGVSTGVVVACGTGYYYPPYVAYYPGYAYPVYYPPPYTYGYVGHYYSPTGAYGVYQTAYGPYGSATRSASYNPYTGTYARTASVSTPYGTAAAGRAYNPYTGASAATRQGSNAYASWGSSVVAKGGQAAYTQHYTNAQGTRASVQTSTGGKAVGASTARGTTTAGKTGSGDIYAGHDGNIYKQTDSGWQRYDNGGWSDAQKPATGGTTQQQVQQRAQSAQQQVQQRGSSLGQAEGGEPMQGLQKEAQNRQRGEQASQRAGQYQKSGSWSASGSGLRSRGSMSAGRGRR